MSKKEENNIKGLGVMKGTVIEEVDIISPLDVTWDANLDSN